MSAFTKNGDNGIWSQTIGPSQRGKRSSMKPFYVALLIILVAVLLAIAGLAEAQVQLMSEEREHVFRSYIPKLKDHPSIEVKLAQAMLYTDVEIPPAYQFQPLPNGSGASYTVLHSPSAQLNGSSRPTNGNRESPWKDPGGLNFVAPDMANEFRMLWLPPNPSGGVWPVVVYRDSLEKSDSVNMPIPTSGWRWIFPEEALVVEVLMKKFSDGTWACYEMRARLRELDDWDVEPWRPGVTEESLVKRIAELRPGHESLEKFKHIALSEIMEERDLHPRPGYRSHSSHYVLPSLPTDLSKDILLTSLFEPAIGGYFAKQGTRYAFSPTATDDDGIVPKGYNGTFLGSDRDSCKRCHEHTLKHVDRFQNREWYGYIRGSDGIFSFHPFEPSCIGPPSKQPVLRRAFVEAGMVAMFDSAIHPSTVYQIAPAYENRPAARYPNTGPRTIGGP